MRSQVATEQERKLYLFIENLFNVFLSNVFSFLQEFLDVGKELVKLGFGTVNRLDQRLLRDKEILSYQKKLVLAEKWAERRRNGLWFFKIDPTLMWRMKMSLEAKLKSKLPMIARQLEV